jgi:predicted membrane protein
MSIVVIIWFWILFGRLCGNMAERQGRDVVTARILWFLFWIFALIIYAIIWNKYDIEYTNKHKVFLKHCSYCGEEIQGKAKKCKHCGEWLTKENK